MARPKLTAAQVAVLRAAAANNVYRSDSINTLYKSFLADTHTNVTRQADRLADLNLIRIGEPQGFHRSWHIEPDGERVLAELDEEVAVPKLDENRVRVLRAAERGHLRHDRYEGYDWIVASDGELGGKVTGTARAALRDKQIELLDDEPGVLGIPLGLTDDGRRALADYDAKEKP